MLEERIEQVQASALERILAASGPEELEAARVDALGRKGALAQFSKDFGKLTAEQRSAAGKALNAAKEALEAAFDSKKNAFETVMRLPSRHA